MSASGGYHEDEIARLSAGGPVGLPLCKRAFDLVVASLALVVTSPLFVLVVVWAGLSSLARPADRGPLLSHETRMSAGRPFVMRKFRIVRETARVDGEGAGLTPKQIENQPGALTAAGRTLKRTGLDELPQLFSVIAGDMTLLGPRPKPLPEYEAELAAGDARRSLLPAGLSGPVQLMKGTDRTSEDERLADLRYIDSIRGESCGRVLAIDCVLLWRTLVHMLKFTGE